MQITAEKECILVVDDNHNTIEILKRNLSAEGYTVFTACHVNEALNILKDASIDLVVTDMKMPDITGQELVRYVRENYSETEIVVITGYPSIDDAVKAVKTGAEEYLPKPFTDQELLSVVRCALDKLLIRKSRHKTLCINQSGYYGLIGDSPAMHKVFHAIEKAAETSATVLITGESGTGKELVARAIHYNSNRAAAPFIPINCGSIPESLLESELFGYVKGAFTGAFESRAGFFQTADGGSIFLDEISETSMAMQVKLLRVLQEKEICMIAARRPQKVDVRILASSNKNLFDLVNKERFREDLFYRLNVVSIEIPPLRERGEDILTLIHYFTRRIAQEMNKETVRFSERALAVLLNYTWPGNVRELENLIQRLVIMNEGEIIDVPALPSLMRYSMHKQTGLNKTLAEVETEYIRNVLASVENNKSQAAKILGIDRKTLREKLKLL